jgi:hypothetical protein
MAKPKICLTMSRTWMAVAGAPKVSGPNGVHRQRDTVKRTVKPSRCSAKGGDKVDEILVVFQIFRLVFRVAMNRPEDP